MSKKIKSEKYSGVYYVKKGSNPKDWIYYCKFRWRNKLYNYRNLTEEFSVTSEKQASEKISILKNEAKKALELGLPNPLERQRIRREQKLEEKKQHVKRTLNEHWEIELIRIKDKIRPNTFELYERFYNNYIKPNIGDKLPEEVKSVDFDYIQYKTRLKDTNDRYKSLLKRLLLPIFDKAIGDGEIVANPVASLKFNLKFKPERKKISKKTKLPHLEISRKIYNAIPQYISQYKAQREEWQQLLYLQLLSGRRYGELFELTAGHIDYENKRINSDEDITKSGKESSFPIPEECQDFILNIKKGKIFKEITYGSYYMVFQRLKEKALTKEIREKYPKINFKKIKAIEEEITKEINEKKYKGSKKEVEEQKVLDVEKKLKDSISAEEFEAYEEYSIYDFELTAHDTRSLFISTLVSLGEDSRLVDAMLDHKQDSEEIVHFYLDISENAKNVAYQKYWKALRRN